jgi:subtilisin-like proprotein convertase family protein
MRVRTAVLGLLVLGVVAALVTPAAADPPESRFRHPHRTDQVIVGYEPGASGWQAQTDPGRGRPIGGGAHVVPVRGSVDATIDELLATPGVRYAEPDYLVQIDQLIPTDALFSSLWGLDNTGVGGGTLDADIDAPEAWATHGTAASGVVVGIVDSGIRPTHQDLVGNLWTNTVGAIGTNPTCVNGIHGYDAVDDTCATATDPNGHGTHVAGTVGAEGGNVVGITGVAHDVQLMNLRFLNGGGSGSTSGAIAALTFAADAREAGVNLTVLNNSWGGGGYSQALADVITRLDTLGVTFVAAAGNSNRDLETSDTYPCEYDVPNVVCVAASTRTDARASFSNYGATAVDLAAPGADILSARGNQDDGYRSLNGTSMASPHVAGAVAMLSSRCPGMPPAAVRAALMASVDRPAAWTDVVASDGRLNLKALLDAAVGCPAAFAAAVPPAVVAERGEVTTELVIHHAAGAAVADLTVGALPTGLSAVLGTPVAAAAVTRVPLTLTAVDAAVGTTALPLTFTAAATPIAANVPVEVIAAAIDLDAPSAVSAPRVTTVDVPITVERPGGYTDPVTLSITGLPDGYTATFTPAVLPSASGSQAATLQLVADARTAVGDPVPLTLTGDAALLSPGATATVQLVRDAVTSPDGGTITIPTTRGPGSPNPSTLVVPPIAGSITDVRLRLDGLTHTWTSDLAIGLTSPAGVTTLVVARAGGNVPSSDVDLLIADTGAAFTTSPLASGTYRPTKIGGGAVNFTGGPQNPAAVPMADLLPGGVAGTWQLWVMDLENQDGGRIDGWSLEIDVIPPFVGPGTPTADDAVNAGDLTLSWTPAERGTTTLVERQPAAGGAATPVTAGTLTESSLALTGTDEPEGRWAYRVTADRALDGATETSGWSAEVVVDRTPPTVDLTGCPTGIVPFGSLTTTVDVTAADALSGLDVDPSGPQLLPAGTAGPLVHTATATDLAGNTATATCAYTVGPAPAGGGGGGGGGGGVVPPAGDPDPPAEPEEPEEPTDPPVDPVGDLLDRVPGTDAASVGIAVSQARFADVDAGAGGASAFAAAGRAHDGIAEQAVLARDDVFADALAGASLTDVGPLLFTDGAALQPAVEAELERILAPGATVYLLGGEAALSGAVEQAVADAGWTPVRLAGASRVETAIAVADAVLAGGGGATGHVLVARAHGPAGDPTAAWADAVTGGAFGADAAAPVLLTPTEGLHPAVAAWTAAHPELAPTLLGGEAALSPAVADALGGADRRAGAERAGTAVAIATGLWATDGSAYTITSGVAEDGWAFGLAAAGLAADRDAPLLLVGE